MYAVRNNLKALNEASKHIMMLLIQPSLKYNCLTHLKLTNTQKEKPSSFDRQTEKNDWKQL